MNRTNPGRRWPRTAVVVLPSSAVVIVVVSLIVSMSGAAAPRPLQVERSRALTSLLTGGLSPHQHRHQFQHRHPVEHRPTNGDRPSQAGTSHSYRPGPLTYPVASAHDISVAPKTQVIASLAHPTKGYPWPNAFSSDREVPGSWYGHQSALPVIATTNDRLLVRLAQRPNGATTWIERRAAVLEVTHWAIVVDLSRHFLYAFYNGVQQYAFPVGTGAPGTPTPTGQFFVAFHAVSNGPGYGPVNIATSAHSTVFRSFDGGDDAIIGIHGPVGTDALIGNHGAAISNGCIRMHLGDLAKVVGHVPDGAPVVLTY